MREGGREGGREGEWHLLQKLEAEISSYVRDYNLL